MRTRAMRYPPTSKRRAAPGARSSRAHRRTASPTAALHLVDDRAAQPFRQRTDRETVEHVVEEPEHDQTLGFFGRNPARLEVVQLIVVDRADGRGVRALHVVRFD